MSNGLLGFVVVVVLAALAVAFAVIGAGVCRIRRFEVSVGQMGKEDDDV